jgi:predicted Zn-dependent protease
VQEAMNAAPDDPWSRLDAADLLVAQGDVDAALTKAREALRLSAAPSGALLKRVAGVEERGGNWETARGYLRQATVVDRNDPHAWSLLANLLIRSGDLPGARQAAEEAARIASGERDEADAAVAKSA